MEKDFKTLQQAGAMALERLGQKVSMIPSGTERRLPDCSICDDTEMVIGEGGARRCQCVRDRARREFYASIPEEFRCVTLDTVRADPARHPRQEEWLAVLRAEPSGSYLLFGANGVGKSLFSWLLVMNAYETGRHTVATDLDRLLKQYRRHEFHDDELPDILADDLRPGPSRYTLRRKDWTVYADVPIESQPVTVFLDEISATTPTEYAAKEFFHLLKAAHEFKHQVIMTCNVTPKQLHAHWSRVDSFWGNSIARRIAEYMRLVDLTK